MSVGTLLSPLTEREAEILQLVADGLSNQDIADRLFLSVGTVKWHNNQIFSKLGVSSRTAAVTQGRRLGLLNETDHSVGPAAPISRMPTVPLPVLSWPLIGRDGLLGLLDTLLSDRSARLVTLVGQGGVGKTSLAVSAAERLTGRFPDGVIFVALDVVDTLDHLVTALASAIGLELDQHIPPHEQTFDYVGDRRLLLVLDNFEQLVPCASFLSTFIRAAPNVTMLVTSRERLNLDEEQLVHVEGLDAEEVVSLDAAVHVPSVQLFVERASAVDHQFQINEHNWPEVTAICACVDGLPLAILMAAAWIELLTPAEIAAELRRGSDFLQSDLRSLPERQRSLRMVFSTSWKLLPEHERGMYARLAVFRGGFTREAAEHVAGAGLAVLLRLASKSLLSGHGSGRFGLHDLLRGFALDQLEILDGSQTALATHTDFYLGRLSSMAMDRLAVDDMENVRAAWAHAVAHGHSEQVEAALTPLVDYCVSWGRYYDALYCMDLAVDAAERGALSGRLGILLRESRGHLYMLVSDHDAAVGDLNTVRRYASDLNDSVWERRALLRLGHALRRTEQPDDAIRHLQTVLREYRQSNDLRACADALYHLGTVQWDMGRNGDALASHREAANICEELRVRDIVAVQAIHGLGEALMFAGDLTGAVRAFDASAALAHEVGDLSYEAENYLMAGWSSLSPLGLGDVTSARAYFERALSLSEPAGADMHTMCTAVGIELNEGKAGHIALGFERLAYGIDLARRIGSKRMHAVALGSMAELYLEQDQPEKALDVLERALTLVDTLQSDYWRPRLMADVAIARMRMGDLTIGSLLDNGLELARDRTVMLHGIHCLEGLAELAVRQADGQAALRWADELLTQAQRGSQQVLITEAHRWRAEAMLILGEVDKARAEAEAALARDTHLHVPRQHRDLLELLARCSPYSA